MNPLIQAISGTVGALGFAMLFNVHGRKLFLIALGSFLSWGCFLLCSSLGTGYAFFCAALLAAVVSEILARVVKAPVLIFLVPMLIPLIPGSDLYYTMSNLLSGQWEQCVRHAGFLVLEASSIAMGIICAAALGRILFTLWKR